MFPQIDDKCFCGVAESSWYNRNSRYIMLASRGKRKGVAYMSGEVDHEGRQAIMLKQAGRSMISKRISVVFEALVKSEHEMTKVLHVRLRQGTPVGKSV